MAAQAQKISEVIDSLINAIDLNKAKNASLELKNLQIEKQLLTSEFLRSFSQEKNFEKHLYNIGFVFKCCYEIQKHFPLLLQCFFNKISNIRNNSNNLSQLIDQFVESLWMYINPSCLTLFFTGFQKNLSLLKDEEKFEYVKFKMENNLFYEVVEGIRFFHLYDKFDRKTICFRIIEFAKTMKTTVDVPLLLSLIHENHPHTNDIAFIKYIVSMLIHESTSQQCNRIISKYNLNINEFPKLIQIIQQKSLRWAVKAKPWYVNEERFSQNDEMLAQTAIMLFQTQKKKEKTQQFAKPAYSIVVRYNLLNKNITSKHQLNDLMKKHKQLSSLAIMMNPIFEKDFFNPMEENIGTSPPGTFLNLNLFEVTENDVIYVESVQDNNFLLAKDCLENSDIIGLDSEFTIQTFSFERQRLSIFQIASPKNAFIFDMEKIANSPKFKEFFIGLLMNDKIMKVGQSILSDIEMLNKNFKNLVKEKDACISNYVEISNLAKFLIPAQKSYSLTNIANMVFGKPLSKGEQCSNWGKKPLRKSQLHYAALDALVCIMIFQQLSKKLENSQKNIKEFQEIVYLNSNGKKRPTIKKEDKKDKKEKNISLKEKLVDQESEESEEEKKRMDDSDDEDEEKKTDSIDEDEEEKKLNTSSQITSGKNDIINSEIFKLHSQQERLEKEYRSEKINLYPKKIEINSEIKNPIIEKPSMTYNQMLSNNQEEFNQNTIKIDNNQEIYKNDYQNQNKEEKPKIECLSEKNNVNKKKEIEPEKGKREFEKSQVPREIRSNQYQPLIISKRSYFVDSQKQTIKSRIDSLLILHENSLITHKSEYQALVKAAFGIVCNFLELYVLHNAISKIDNPSQKIEKCLPNLNNICLLFFKKISKIKGMESQLKNLCQQCKREYGKGISVVDNLCRFLIYDKNKKELFVSEPIMYFDVKNCQIKLKENYMEFFESLISFIEN